MAQSEFSIVEASRLWKKSRNTIGKHIKDGALSRNSNGKIAIVELLRVYGAMPSADDVQHMSSTIEQPRAHESAHVEQLKKHIETLEKQVAFLQREIEESRQARIAYQQPQKRGLLARLLGD